MELKVNKLKSGIQLFLEKGIQENSEGKEINGKTVFTEESQLQSFVEEVEKAAGNRHNRTFSYCAHQQAMIAVQVEGLRDTCV